MKKASYTSPEVKEVFLETEGVIMGFGSNNSIANPLSLDDDFYGNDFESIFNRDLRRL